MPPASSSDRWTLFGLGSNIRPEKYLPEAARRLAEHATAVRCSSVWQSRPVGFRDQPDFLNAVVAIRSRWELVRWQEELIPAIEQQLGRQRDPNNKNAPRTIDIDLLLHGDWVGAVGKHRLPAPELLERWFVAVPAAEVAPYLRHPTDGRTLRQIAHQLWQSLDETPRTRPDVVLLE
ncbi:MAG: 2-amino-4-hydroxy-6-hydroxymethyldihydropteridine diphosphokinase [Pirellulaceae bacterium]|nr:MAG: 2-amino-4-hydroxy-6-hydroxymethyldihydropteridine diphosphokinase [Pirellulaceae bacterium]